MTYEHRTFDSKQEVASEIEEWVDDARDLAEEIGLDPYHVNYWIVDNHEMNVLATYGGFQRRYPHWRWGMKYDRQQKQSQYTGSRIFELVNNDNPAHAFLQRSNTTADQKSVVTHVEAHSDFFKNNRWFDDDPNAAQMLESHAERIEEIMERPDVDRSDVEALIDTVMCIEDTIDQHKQTKSEEDGGASVEDHIEEMDIDESIKEQLFDEEWVEEVSGDDEVEFHDDVIEFIIEHGKRFDEDEEKAVEFEEWERDVLSMMRKEAYYFAPQKMTKVMNEGWASFWETMMMADEGFADDDEFVEYADHHAKVLEAPGFNPYKLGREIWEYIENRTNRREVIDKLLRVDGVTPGNFHRRIDFDEVQRLLDHPDTYVAEKRNYSLVRPKNRGFIRNVQTSELEEQYRYMMGTERYESVEEAIGDVNYGAGWERMREIRETHVDSTFIGEFITEEFIEQNDYFTYDYNHQEKEYQVSSTDPKDVKKKLLLKFTNFGKPTIVAQDHNYNNAGELLLAHNYNGVSLDMEQAKDVIERLFDVWGRPVNFRTISKVVTAGDKEQEVVDKAVELRYDGDGFEMDQYEPAEFEYLQADDVDYDVRPEGWL